MATASANHDISWWARLIVAIIGICGTGLTVGAAVADRPTEEATRDIVKTAIEAHAQGAPPHVEIKEIQTTLQRLEIDIATIRAVVTNQMSPDEGARAPRRTP